MKDHSLPAIPSTYQILSQHPPVWTGVNLQKKKYVCHTHNHTSSEQNVARAWNSKRGCDDICRRQKEKCDHVHQFWSPKKR